MSKSFLELEHSQAAGAEAVLVMLALFLAILVSAAAFAMTMAGDLQRQAARVSQATRADPPRQLSTGPGPADDQAWRWRGQGG